MSPGDAGRVAYRIRLKDPCPDVNGDGFVNLADLITAFAHYARDVQPYTSGDTDGAGHVDASDLEQILEAWGPHCG